MSADYGNCVVLAPPPEGGGVSSPEARDHLRPTSVARQLDQNR
jgi:hypothetical protein